MTNNKEDVAFLLRTGTCANSKDEAGKTPLMTASSRGHVGVVQLLVAHLPKKALEERAIKGWTALQFAADRGREEVVRCLLMNGAQASSKDNRGRTPLMHASRRGHLGVVKTLLHMVGNDAIEERDGEGWTALLFAAAGGHEEVSAFLLSNGAQASSENHIQA
jgi:ankyrin repeat protein